MAYDLVRVTWRDAHTTEDRWTAVSDMALTLRLIQSVGYLVGETDELLALAQDVDLDGDSEPWANSVGAIPKGCVVTIERLAVQEPPPSA